MANQASASGSNGLSDYNTVFIDTSLNTHLITVVSSSDTVSDLRKKVSCEHALCFPHIGVIKVLGIKVKRRGKFYYLSDSMLVKSVFHGVKRNWFITVDACSLEERNSNANAIVPLSNNMLSPVGVMNFAFDKPALPESCSNPLLLANVGHKQLKKQIDSCDQHMDLEVAGQDGSRDMDIGVELMEGTCREATPVDANDESLSSMQEKGDQYGKEQGIKDALKEGAKSISKGGIYDKPDSIASEERAVETTPDKKKRCKNKWNRDVVASKEDNAEVLKYSMHVSGKETEESDSYLGNAKGVVSSNDDGVDGPSTNSSPEGSKGSGPIGQRVTTQSEKTSELGKLVELNNVESLENRVDTLGDQLLKGNPQVEPAAKRRRTVKQAEKDDGDSLKDDGTMVSESNKVSLDISAVSQKSHVGKQRRRNASLDGSSTGTPELQLASPSNKKRKGEKKSAKTFNREAAAVPSSMANNGVEHFEMPNNSSNLSENSAAELARDVQDALNANDPKDKQDGSVEETNLRPSSVSKCSELYCKPKNKEASGAAVESNMKRKIALKNHHADDSSYAEIQASNSKEKRNEISNRNEIHDNYQNHFSNQNGGVDEYRNHVSGHNNRVDEGREIWLEFSPKIASSENYKISAQDDLQLKTEEPENVNPLKLSKKKKKSKKTKDLVSETPSASVTEHEEGFLSSTSPSGPHKVAKCDHPSDTSNKQERNRLPEVWKEMDTVHTSFLVSDKEISDVIQNMVESVQRMGKDQVGIESLHGKSRKKSGKKQNSDAKLLESIKQNKNIGSLLECGKDTTAEKDQGIQFEQVLAQKLDINSKKGFPEAVVSGSPSISDRPNEVTNDVDVTGKSNGVNLDEATKTNGSHDMVKTKKKTKKKKKKKKKQKQHDAHSDGPSSDLKNAQVGKPTVGNHGVGAKPHTEDSSPAEVEVSFTKENSEKVTLKSNNESSKASDEGEEPLVSSNPHRVNSVPEEARRYIDAKPTAMVSGSKRKKVALNLLSSNPHKVSSVSEEGQQSSDAKFTGMVNGSKSKNAELNLESSDPHKVNFVPEGGRRSNDARHTGMVSGSKSKKAELDLVSSNADVNMSQYGSYSRKREEGGRKANAKPFSPEMTLDIILRSSRSYKKAKQAASQLQAEDTESQPLEFVPDSGALP